MKLKTIEEEWTGFSEMIFSKLKVPPGPVQVEETKRAFFAGAWAMLTAFVALGGPQFSEEQAVRFLEEREEEGRAFYQDLIRKHAEGN